jgi:hypothetical protein
MHHVIMKRVDVIGIQGDSIASMKFLFRCAPYLYMYVCRLTYRPYPHGH